MREIGGLLRRHARACAAGRALLAGRERRTLSDVVWYDLPFRFAVSHRGFLKVLLWNLTRRSHDVTMSSYGLNPVYTVPPRLESVDRPAPSVWSHRAVRTPPWVADGSPAKEILEQNVGAIRAEFLAASAAIREHPENGYLVDAGRWDSIFLFGTRGALNDAVAPLFPRTLELLRSVPLCTTFGFAMFSTLQPGTHILPHTGSSNLRLRHHLCVASTGDDLASIRVGSESRVWRDGECLVFDDSYEHEVHNRSSRPRTVLIVDTWHPHIPPADVETLSDPLFAGFGRY